MKSRRWWVHLLDIFRLGQSFSSSILLNNIVLLHSLAGKSSFKSSAKFLSISHASHVHYKLYIPLARLVGVHMSCWLFARLFQNCQVTATHKQGYFESNGQLCLYGDNSQNSNSVRTGFVPFLD